MSVIGSNLLAGASGQAGAAAADYTVQRSLRFNNDDSAYLSKPFASAGNRRTFTFSCWVKAPKIANTQQIIFSASTGSTPYTSIDFRDNNLRILEWNGSSVVFQVKTDAILRDPSAWYHVVIAVDTTQSTAADRVKIYINGTQQTSFATASYPSQNHQLYMNSSALHYVGDNAATSYAASLEGYLAEVNFIDGQALAASDFGEYDDNNNWNPKDTSGLTLGTNGFKLSFSDNSSNVALGYDQSVDTPTLNPDGGMDVVTYTGNGSAQTISGLGFQPDFVWIKNSSTTDNHVLFDVARGATKYLSSNATTTETTQSTTLTSFNSDGFSVGSNDKVNQNGSSLVAWAWKAGGAASLNENGSIDSQVSASTDYGFSIVTYTGTGANNTVGHGLSSAPKWILVKRRNSSESWGVYHVGIGNGHRLLLDDNSVKASTTTWNNTTPTSSVFSVGVATLSNGNNDTYVAYCWSEVSGFSKFGSYTGTGVSSGNVITVGFKPRYVLIKNTSRASAWRIYDTVRGNDKVLQANTNIAEFATGDVLNFTDTSFEPTGTTNEDTNKSGDTYIYAAFADRPGNNFDVNNLVATTHADGAEGFDAVTYTGNGGTQVIGGPVYSSGVSAYVNSLGSEPATNLFDGSTSTNFYSNSTSGSGIKFVPETAITGSIELYLRNGDTANSTFSYSLDGGSTFTNLTTTGGSGSYVSIGSQTISTTNGIIVKHVTTAGTNSVNWRAIKVDGTVLVDGTGAPLKFQPDLVWIKKRGGSGIDRVHSLTDSVRGVGNALESNSSSAEYSDPNALTAFNSDGFSIGSEDRVNENNGTYVAWAWNAGADSNKTYTVKVVSDSGNKYRFDDFGTSAVTLDLQEGSTYVFDQSDSSNAGHPIRFGTSANGTDYTTGVTHTGTPGSAGAKTTLVLGTGVATLYYSCANHSGMGGQINTNSTAGASNFDGSIQSVAKGNQEYGFSIVTYTGTGSNATVGHGLSSAPKWVLYKSRGDGNDWMVYHTSMGATKSMLLNSTGNEASRSDTFNDTDPTSSVLHIGTSATTNNTNSTGMIAYCWAEVPGFSKISSYTGTGSSGHSIATGFAAAFVMIKRTDSAGHWAMYDTARGDNYWIEANNSDAEQTHSTMNLSFTSTGFTINGADGNINASNGTYVYMAFAGTPDSSIIDSLIDTPTDYEADSGNNGGNYATLNPVSVVGNNPALRNGNLSWSGTANGITSYISTIASDKFYYEAVFDVANGGGAVIGVLGTTQTQGDSPGRSDDGYTWRCTSGKFFINGSDQGSYGSHTGDGTETIGVAVDSTAGTLEFFVDGTSQGIATSSLPAGKYFATVADTGSSSAITDCTVNFGQRPFAYTPPTGYKSLCTTNLPDPTIADGSTAMDVVTYAGNASTQTISGLSFSPDFIWIKERTDEVSHYLGDTVRGVNKALQSNTTQSESTNNGYGYISTATSDGFTVTAGSTDSFYTNGSPETYVAWAWDGGDSTSTISVGDLNSSFYNQDQVWSGTASGGTMVLPWTEAFDGNIDGSNAAQTGGSDATVTFNPAINVGSGVEIAGGSGATVTFNLVGGSSVSDNPSSYSSFSQVSGLTNGQIQSITLSANQALSGVKVDGKILVDQNVTPPASYPTIASNVRANPSAGFSIVTYNGSGTTSTIGHGLNAVPELIITKNRDSGSFNWGVYHVAAGNTVYLKLNTTDAVATQATWQNTTPTSSIFYVGNYNSANQTADDYVAYCFAPVEGYSAFGSYEGTGTSDNSAPFIYTGFRPKFLLVKGNANIDWIIEDSSRDTFNEMNKRLYPNDGVAESTSSNGNMDFLSNGFKPRTTHLSLNSSGTTYYYAAFAEHPFKTARAR